MDSHKLFHSCVLHIQILILQHQTGVVQGSYITPFTPVYQQQVTQVVVQQPPPPAAQQQQQTSSQQQQTQQLYIATNYQQSSVPPVLLQQPANQQVRILVPMYVRN
jgi:hypothetical protein